MCDCALVRSPGEGEREPCRFYYDPIEFTGGASEKVVAYNAFLQREVFSCTVDENFPICLNPTFVSSLFHFNCGLDGTIFFVIPLVPVFTPVSSHLRPMMVQVSQAY